MLTPEQREAELGRAEVRALFRVPKLGVVAGSLRHQRHDHPRRARPRSSATASSSTRAGSARSAASRTTSARCAQGFECGIGIENFQDVKEGDVIEAYEVREVAREL